MNTQLGEDSLLDNVPERVSEEIPDVEQIDICLKGSNKEWLICTDKKLYIVKRGFMTGHAFGGGIYQMPYANITGVQTEFHLLTGFFQVSSGGMQSTKKSYWGATDADPQHAPNCVSINSKALLQRFRLACNVINEKITEAHQSAIEPTRQGGLSPSDKISSLASLHDQGILTDEEFSAAKAKALGI